MILLLLLPIPLKMNILLAPDSFKDCMRAIEVAVAISRGLGKVIPDAVIRLVPMADGGEGTVESVINATGGEIIKLSVHDPLMRKVSSFYGVSGDGSTAVIEMAAASGLELLGQAERNPWITSTYGTGELIRHALERGCRKILLGIGGSATNDGGVGMAFALGVNFLDNKGKPVPQGGGALSEVRQIRMEGLNRRISEIEILVACDVTNPLTGRHGASYVYGPQKGADRVMVEQLDKNLIHLAGLIAGQLDKQIEKVPGAGAAGGLGGGLMAFLGARLVKGFDLVAETVSLEKSIPVGRSGDHRRGKDGQPDHVRENSIGCCKDGKEIWKTGDWSGRKCGGGCRGSLQGGIRRDHAHPGEALRSGHCPGKCPLFAGANRGTNWQNAGNSPLIQSLHHYIYPVHNSPEEFRINIIEFAENIDRAGSNRLVALTDRSGPKEDTEGGHVWPISQIALRNFGPGPLFQLGLNGNFKIDLFSPDIDISLQRKCIVNGPPGEGVKDFCLHPAGGKFNNNLHDLL